MPEHLHNPRRDMPRYAPIDTGFEKRQPRYVETLIHPGDTAAREIKPLYRYGEEPVVTAYIRTSALARDGVDALQLSDVRGLPIEDDGTKRAYGKVIPREAKYMLVDVNQLGQDDADVPGFVVLFEDQEYEFGRGTESARDFTMGPGTSRRHFKLAVSNGSRMLKLQDLGSRSGLAFLELTNVSADGTPIRYPGTRELSAGELQSIDEKLGRIDAAPVSSEQKRAARELLTRGTMNGKDIDYEPVARNPDVALGSREFVAGTVLRDFNVAKTLVDKEIVGFHGTRSVALLGMMERGMQSASALRNAGHLVVSGEHIYHHGNGLPSTSFGALAGYRRILEAYAKEDHGRIRSLAEVQYELQNQAMIAAKEAPRVNIRNREVYEAMAHDNRTAAEYIGRDPNSLFAQMLQHDFPVVVGVSRGEVERQRSEHGSRVVGGEKDYDEFRLDTSEPIPMESFPVVAVPQRYVHWVQQLMKYFGHESVEVVPLEAFPQNRI